MAGVGIVLATNFFGLILVIAILWLVALQIRDVSFIDAFWAFGMVLLAWGTAIQVGNDGLRAQLLLGLTTLWGLRLALHLLIRWRRSGDGGGHDHRRARGYHGRPRAVALRPAG